ncbi:hypothetical protein C0Q70_11152 [Pomacea canaliculata]|uniref:Uncharacterized protein n=1 Tax=Pomacea canaliculata TaxID=400727 RepID=A0A2T7P589_POMCA|nr:hypothetical protein C0Q70_11152 [Pomacea canaliculata]
MFPKCAYLWKVERRKRSVPHQVPKSSAASDVDPDNKQQTTELSPPEAPALYSTTTNTTPPAVTADNTGLAAAPGLSVSSSSSHHFIPPTSISKSRGLLKCAGPDVVCRCARRKKRVDGLPKREAAKRLAVWVGRNM